MSHFQTVSAGEDMVMEQKGSPKEPGEVKEVDEIETQNHRQTDGTQNSNSDESKSKCSLFFSLWLQSY